MPSFCSELNFSHDFYVHKGNPAAASDTHHTPQPPIAECQAPWNKKKKMLNFHNTMIGWINLILCFLPDWESLAHRNSCLPGMPRIALCLLFVFVFSNLNFILHLEKTFLASVISPVIWNLLLVSYLLKICGQMPLTLSNLDSV